jgi:hypothetical protein
VATSRDEVAAWLHDRKTKAELAAVLGLWKDTMSAETLMENVIVTLQSLAWSEFPAASPPPSSGSTGTLSGSLPEPSGPTRRMNLTVYAGGSTAAPTGSGSATT